MNVSSVPKSPELAAIYRRVSTDHQDGSLAQQERRVIDYVDYRHLETSEGLTFSDPDTSGRTPMFDRTGGRALLNRLKLGDVKHLVIAKLDRLGRNVQDALGVLKFLDEKGVTLHITDFGGESISTQGHMGRLILTVLLAVAEWEVEEIRDRTRKTMAGKFNRMELTGNVPFGFDCRYTFSDGHVQTSAHALSPEEIHDLAHGEPVAKQLVDNPEEQRIILWMHSLRQTPASQRSTTSLKAIADAANTLGYVTKLGRAWTTGSVDSVLTSRHTQLVVAGAKESIEEAA